MFGSEASWRNWSVGRLVLVGFVGLVLLFILIGSFTPSNTPTSGFVLEAQTQPFLLLTLMAFGGGLLSFVSPCTLPILPAYFAFAFQSGRKQIALNTLVFMLGLATMFSLLGATASAIGRILLNSKDLLVLLGGSLVIIFGVMSLLGKGFAGIQSENEPVSPNATLGGSFLFGLTFAVGWSTCVGPILGTMLTLAATTGSVLRGMLLLFIYALGLGLPLLIVSTFFGRASRQSLFWRILRGKGWQVTVHVALIGLVWALAIWRILVALAQFAFFNIASLRGQELTVGLEIGLLGVAIAAVALWIFSQPGERNISLQLHSTQLISGALFILMGFLLLNGTLATLNSQVPLELTMCFADLEDNFMNLLARRELIPIENCQFLGR